MNECSILLLHRNIHARRKKFLLLCTIVVAVIAHKTQQWYVCVIVNATGTRLHQCPKTHSTLMRDIFTSRKFARHITTTREQLTET